MTCFVKKLAPPEVGITAVFLPVISEAPNHGGGLKKRGGGVWAVLGEPPFPCCKGQERMFLCLFTVLICTWYLVPGVLAVLPGTAYSQHP